MNKEDKFRAELLAWYNGLSEQEQAALLAQFNTERERSEHLKAVYPSGVLPVAWLLERRSNVRWGSL